MKKPVLWIGIIVILVVIIAVVVASRGNKGNSEVSTVKVEKNNIIDKALAVGSIEPFNEIAVKSKVSGVVKNLFVGVGDFVNAGDPLLEVKPDPTPLELAETTRNVERMDIAYKTLAAELVRSRQLQTEGLISDYEYEQMKQLHDQAALNKKMAEERLDLIEKGKINIEGTDIETVIKSPITGYILEKSINVGDPVVPLTSYQAGTELMKMANMDNLLFKGTVDEIDVGKIKEGMNAQLIIGALPGKTVEAQVSLISLKALKVDNATVFPVEIKITDAGDAVLRAGFSANANIIISQKDSVLTLPERVITFRNDSAFVQLPNPDGETPEERSIETGLSDAILIEVISGLEEGEEVLEKKFEEIT
ncbi:efflux RND transporter periplasmic adaptor subunit [candidate division KSB1 bacterium]|nr:efflux RND transporter periplasmic adaptor subunit [candidate division KSB1 bacterium]